MGISSVNLNNINIDNNFDKDHPHTITTIIPFIWQSKVKKRKAL